MTAKFWIIFALGLFSPFVISLPHLDNDEVTASFPWLTQAKNSKTTPLADIPLSSSRINGASTPGKAVPQTTELPSESNEQREVLRPARKPASYGAVTPARRGWLQRSSNENWWEEASLQRSDRSASFGETSPARRGSSRRIDVLSKSAGLSMTASPKQSDSGFSDTLEQMSLPRNTDQVPKSASVQRMGPLQKQKSSLKSDFSSTFKAACNYEKVMNNDPDQNSQCTRECIDISTAIEEAYEDHPFLKGIEALFDDCAGFAKGSCAKMTRAGRKKYPVCNCIGWTDAENFRTEYAYKCRTRFMKLKNSDGVTNNGKKGAEKFSKERV